MKKSSLHEVLQAVELTAEVLSEVMLLLHREMAFMTHECLMIVKVACVTTSFAHDCRFHIAVSIFRGHPYISIVFSVRKSFGCGWLGKESFRIENIRNAKMTSKWQLFFKSVPTGT